MSHCRNCGDSIHVPDDRTGVIHEHGKYACYETDEKTGKPVRLDTVAE